MTSFMPSMTPPHVDRHDLLEVVHVEIDDADHWRRGLNKTLYLDCFSKLPPKKGPDAQATPAISQAIRGKMARSSPSGVLQNTSGTHAGPVF
jgi:hypothetical protein